jgi:hypothetical protein
MYHQTLLGKNIGAVSKEKPLISSQEKYCSGT